MIKLTRLNNEIFVLNSDHIENIESTPDTVITLSNGKKIVVSESIDLVINKVINYKKRIFNNDFNTAYDLRKEV